jgi:hypothetical protein
VFTREDVDFVTTKLALIVKNIKNPHLPRAAHIDLAITGDAAGLAIGHVSGFCKMEMDEGGLEIMPTITFDGLLRIKPPPGGEIQFAKIRQILYKLRELGMNIKWVSLDSFQSTDTIQLLINKGFCSGTQSIDTTMLPYDLTRTAFYQGRILAPKHAVASREMVSLELDVKKGKVDHPPNFSKDVADAMAGVIYQLTMQRENWMLHGVPVNQGLREAVAKNSMKMKTKNAYDHGHADIAVHE